MAENRRHVSLSILKTCLKARMILFCLFFSILMVPHIGFTQINSAASGFWNVGANWVGGVVPAAGQSVVINHDITVNINTPTLGNITVSAGGILRTQNTGSSTLTYNGNMSVAGALINNGGIVLTSGGKTFTMSGTGSYIHNPANVTSLDESIFINSTENFSATSSLSINKWFDTNIPLGRSTTRVSGNFGNVTLNIPDAIPWEQDDQFMAAGVGRIKGTLTVSSGIVRMDQGTVGTPSTYMEFNDIIINGTGSIIFLSGPTRPLVLYTNNFTDISTSANPTVIMDNVFNLTTQWNANGNVTLGHNFFGIVGTGVNPGGAMNVQISGNLAITGGNVQFISQNAAPLTLAVNGNTTISGNPSKVRFIDGSIGSLNFSTNNFTISGGTDNVLMGGNNLYLSPLGTSQATVVINNDLIVNGASNSYIVDARNNTRKLKLQIGHDFIINGTNANFTAARTLGALEVFVTNNMTLSAGRFIGQIDTANVANDSLFVGGHFVMNTPNSTDYLRINYGSGNTFFRCNGNYTLQSTSVLESMGFTGIYSGRGNMNFHVVGIFTMSSGRLNGIFNTRTDINLGNLTFTAATNFNISGGYFRGIDSRVDINTATVTFNIGNLLYSGGNFSGYHSIHTATPAGVATFTINGIMQITYGSNPADSFMFIGYSNLGGVYNTLRLNVSILGNFNITGPVGTFISSVSFGEEVFNVTGNVNFSGGNTSFNSFPNSGLANPHLVTLNFGSDFTVFGGTHYLSANNGALVATIGGNLAVSLGELVIQSGSAVATVNVLGGYTQTGGNLFLHKNNILASSFPVNLTINSDNNATGNFAHTNGTITFDNNTASTQVFMNINSPNIEFGGSGIITMANPGTNIISGVIRYGKTGVANYSRTSNTHSLQQVEQHILTGCTLTVVTGNIVLASHANMTFTRLNIFNGAVLDLGSNQVLTNGLQANTGFILFAGRIRTTRPEGFYDGTTNAAISSAGAMNYLIFSNSTIEYYGANNQVITGIGVGTATGPSQKYYDLEINFTGTPNSEFVYPTNIPNNRSVFVRHKLILTNGELNLDDDHNPVSGGRAIIIESDSLTAITRTNGYIRSESYDSTGMVIWNTGTRTGPRIIPFGYNSTNYIPFTFDLVSGDADTIFVSTYHTPASNNLPFPPTVTHLRDLAGTDNSANTVDRFWYIASTGTSTNANLTFKCTAAELGTIANPRAQCWIPDAITPNAWQYPLQGTQSTSGIGTYVAGADYYPRNWWTLAGLLTPLPVTLLDFTATCNNDYTELKWSTASEQNNDFFTILKSLNGSTYYPIGRVEGNGTTTNISHYYFTDEEINSKVTYFKIVQTDYDGEETVYGPIIANPCGKIEMLDVNVFPSSPEELTVLIRNPISDKFHISLYSIDGKLILSKSQNLDKGLNVVGLPVENLSSGIYFVNVKSTTESSTTKVSLGMVR